MWYKFPHNFLKIVNHLCMALPFTLSHIFPGIAGADVSSEMNPKYFYLLSVMAMNSLTIKLIPSRILSLTEKA